jgi:Papain-like cysteine protease AvrRpt2
MKRLDFKMRHQILRDWCWAACSASVRAFFDPASTLTECDIAGQELHLACCASAQQCNRTHRLDLVLKNLKHLRGTFVTGALSFTDIQSEIDANTPICVRIEWPDGAGHFATIAGYTVSGAGVKQVLVEDPFHGPSRIDPTLMKTNYQGDGKWTHTFLLQSK